MATKEDWLDLVLKLIEAVGSLATFGAFLYLFFQQRKSDQQQVRNNIQQFESSLFNLLSLHNQIVSSLTYEDKTGRAVFGVAKHIVEHMLLIQPQRLTEAGIVTYNVNSKEDAKEALKQYYYLRYYNEFESNFNHYFRNLYHIFLYIDTTNLLVEDDIVDIKRTAKYKYLRIVRAQLSQNELFLIMLNCLMQGYGYPELLKLDKKYSILMNFRTEDVNPEHFYELYLEMRSSVQPETRDGGIISQQDE